MSIGDFWDAATDPVEEAAREAAEAITGEEIETDEEVAARTEEAEEARRAAGERLVALEQAEEERRTGRVRKIGWALAGVALGALGAITIAALAK